MLVGSITMMTFLHHVESFPRFLKLNRGDDSLQVDEWRNSLETKVTYPGIRSLNLRALLSLLDMNPPPAHLASQTKPSDSVEKAYRPSALRQRCLMPPPTMASIFFVAFLTAGSMVLSAQHSIPLKHSLASLLTRWNAQHPLT